MFAAALTLLARARGIPARVVTGYRVSEVNPISGFAVVRERNAHAWVVAWVDGRWVTVDPTPAAEMLGKPKPTWSALVFDALATWVERGWAAALRVDPVSAGLGFVALGLSYIGLRRAFLALRKRRSAGVTAVTSAALSSYDDLERALARAGLLRKASEPIERFADRVASGTEAWAPEVAAVIRAYAGHSYGGLGAEPEIALSLSGLAARVTREASA
jgi:transglutaminase-like putative cysteine protease